LSGIEIRADRVLDLCAQVSRVRAWRKNIGWPKIDQHLARLHLTRGDEEKAAAELRIAAGLGTLDRDLGLKLADLEIAAADDDAARRVLRWGPPMCAAASTWLASC
jgi:hypothetical protein